MHNQESWLNKQTDWPNRSWLQSEWWAKWKDKQGKEVWSFSDPWADGSHLGELLTYSEDLPYNLGRIGHIPRGPSFDPNTTFEQRNTSLQEFLQGSMSEFKGLIALHIEPSEHFPYLEKLPKIHSKLPQQTLLTNLNLTAEELLAQMHPKTRYNIRLAERHGVSTTFTTQEQFTPELIDTTVGLIQNTAQRQNFHSHGAKYYKDLLEFSQNLTGYDAAVIIGIASFNGQALAAGIFISYIDTFTYLFGGSSDAHKEVMAPYDLHWNAIQLAQQYGKENYDWWGTEDNSGRKQGFGRFKQGFGGEIVAYPPAREIKLASGWKWWRYKLARLVQSLMK